MKATRTRGQQGKDMNAAIRRMVEDGQGSSEIAELLGLPLTTVEQRASRMRKAGTLRLPKATAPYVARASTLTIAKALIPVLLKTSSRAKQRQASMRACMCPLCDWCLNPALTFEEHARRKALAGKWNASRSWPKHRGGAR